MAAGPTKHACAATHNTRLVAADVSRRYPKGTLRVLNMNACKSATDHPWHDGPAPGLVGSPSHLGLAVCSGRATGGGLVADTKALAEPSYLRLTRD